ncbi:sll1863 family stress response protein [Williamwhitmania taraxaci]|uniref:Uncharacterized protein n=1 Tax=Williamwhitmania taraxaci TaxID=1640674 RepID=A0A1G6HFE2_9BACT|nr:hypothetical protein [Williamwhitmania taraxaci]SDB92828.1 hypothetical protein SAMN05216323_101019 [Williamwhitmania taraxaci]
MDKQTFKENAKKSIDDIFAKIEELEAKNENFKERSKIEYDENLAELKAKRDELQAKYRELENATEEKWDEVKIAFSSASESFKEGFSKITALFK